MDPSLGPSSIAVLSLGPGSSVCICFLTARVCRDSLSASCSPSGGLSVTVRQDGFCAVLPVRGTSSFSGVLSPSRWHRACGWTEEELAPSRAAGAGAGGRGWWSERRFPRPPAGGGSLVPRLSFPPGGPLATKDGGMAAEGRPLSQPEQRT